MKIEQEKIEQDTTRFPVGLTVEHSLYGLALLIAAGLRLFALDANPLNPNEAVNAWSAWLQATGGETSLAPQPLSALYHTLHTLLFWPAFGGDALARLIAALAGCAIVLLPWWWRPTLGRITALACAFLFALDPWLVAFSRMADGAMLSIFLGLLTLTGLMVYAKEQVLSEEEWERQGERDDEALSPSPPLPRSPAWLAVSIALLFASGPLAWSFLPVLFFYIFLQGNTEWRALLDRRMLMTGGATFLFIATTWFTSPQSLKMIGASFNAWLGQFTSTGGESLYHLSWWFTRVLTDQPFLLVFGLGGLLLLLRGLFSLSAERQVVRWVWFVLAWLAWGLLLGLLPGRNPFALPMIGLPLILCSALVVGALVRRYDPSMVWEEGGLLIAILTVLAVASLFYVLTVVSAGQFDLLALRPMIVMMGLAVVLLVLFALWLDAQQAWLIGGGLTGVILLLATVSAGWRLNFVQTVTTPDGLFVTVTHPDVRNLAQDVATLSAQRMGDPGTMEVRIKLNANGQADPVVGWYLRTMRNALWLPGVAEPETEPKPLLIAQQETGNQEDGAGEEQKTSLGATYMGSSYRTAIHWLPQSLRLDPATLEAAQPGLLNRLQAGWSAGWRARLRWLIFREVKTPIEFDTVTLWVP